MRRLRELQSERGAAAIIVAILLGTGFLIVSVSMVIDGGRLFLERRVLQSTADVVAVTAAQACAAKDLSNSLAAAADCQNPPANIASAMNLSSSARVPYDPNQTEAFEACGPTASLGSCGSTSLSSFDCQDPVDGKTGLRYTHYSRVYTRTTQAGVTGGTALYPLFAPFLGTGSGGAKMAACSQVAWVYPSIANVPNATYFPFAFSQCEYSETSRVSVGYYASTPTCSGAIDHGGTAISCGVGGCSGGIVGFSYSTTAGCSSVSGGKLSLYGTSNSIGAPSSNICVKTKIGDAPSVGTANLSRTVDGTYGASLTPEAVYTVPLYDKLTGSPYKIRISGFGFYHLLGYKFPGASYVSKKVSAPSWPTSCGAASTSGNNWCLYGYFEPHVYSTSPNSELVEIARPTFWDGTFAIKRIP